MKTGIIIAEAAIFAALFTLAVFKAFAGDRKYSPGAIADYPSDIQEEYFKTHERVDTSYKSKNVIMTKLTGIVLFAAILTGCCAWAGAHDFRSAFLLTFGLMVWIGAYDTFFLDWIVFANVKSFRLEGTEHMDEAYHQKWFHLKGALFPGLLFAAAAAVLTAGIVALIY